MNNGDVSINGKPYRVDIPTYRGKDMSDFSPRASTPGGSVAYSELLLYQVSNQTDFRHGFGFHWYEDAMGYQKTNGNVDTRQAGLAMLFTQATASDANNEEKTGIVLFNDILYAFGEGGLRKYASSYLTGYLESNIDTWAKINGPSFAVGDTLTYAIGSPQTSYVHLGNLNGVTYRIAQTLKTTNGGRLKEIELYLSTRIGTPLGNITWSLYADNSGAPAATLLASGEFELSPITISGVVQGDGTHKITYTLPSTVNIYLTAGTTYWLTYALPAQTNNNYYTLPTSAASVVANVSCYASSNGAAWSDLTRDLFMHVETEAVVGYTKSTQSFPLTTFDVKSVAFYLRKVGTPTGNAYITIEADSGGSPSGTALATSANVDIATLTTALAKVLFTFTSAYTPAAPGTYHAVLNCTSTPSTASWIEIGYDSSAPVYTSGVGKLYSGSWSAPGIDFAFEVNTTDLGSSTTWADEYTSADVNCALATKSYLFYCPKSGRIRKISTTGTHTDAGAGTNSSDYSQLIVFNGYVYAIVRNTNRVHSSALDDLSDLEGASTDPNKVLCGTNTPILNAIVFAGKLYFAKADGLWQMGEDKVCRRVLNYTTEESASNFLTLVEHNGNLVFAIRDKLIQWNGARVSYITPPRLNDTFPFTTYGLFKCATVVGDMLYVIARTNEADYKEALLAFDGVGWHKLMDLITTGSGTISMVAYEAKYNRLWYHLNAAADATYYIPFQAQSVFSYANFPITGEHSIETSRWDMGYRRVTKSSPSILIEASNLLEGHRTLGVYYSLDGGAYVLLDTVDTDGISELNFTSTVGTVEYRYMQIKVTFVTDDPTQSPVLESVSLRFLMRPDSFYGYNMNIVAAMTSELGEQADDRTPAQIKADLRTARDSKAPIEFIDLFGNTTYGYITSIMEQAVERHLEENGVDTNVEMMININISEVA